jgi:hypothetical protein
MYWNQFEDPFRAPFLGEIFADQDAIDEAVRQYRRFKQKRRSAYQRKRSRLSPRKRYSNRLREEIAAACTEDQEANPG